MNETRTRRLSLNNLLENGHGRALELKIDIDHELNAKLNFEIGLPLQCFSSFFGTLAPSASSPLLRLCRPHLRHTRRHRSIARKDPTATGLFNRVASEGPPNTDDERELEGEFCQKDIYNNDDHDSASCTGARLVHEIS
ncbi:hypothetical protein TorRG33x02_231120 [Trema orientale]|uniref:Uncharacterized protein n=1 Tax=Trema orientale TaxID=63057 RepID=A0A2P5E6B9_TREOI|nr:hypothetical protein TorRG33x02_231120 [Trema orientale]